MQIRSKSMESPFGLRSRRGELQMRIVSLVPSLTLTLFELGCTVEEIVGRTPWCIHPKEAVEQVQVVGGTKTPNVKKIMALEPALVVLDREENPKSIHDELVAAGINVFVSSVEHPSEVPEMLRQLGKAIERQERAEEWASSIESKLQSIKLNPLQSVRVAPMIWHEPLMSVGPEKYAGGLLTALGLEVPALIQGGNGYPVVTPEALIEHNVEWLLLSSEPHDFALEEGEAIAAEILKLGGQVVRSTCIDGEALTWFGTATLAGLETLHKTLSEAS